MLKNSIVPNKASMCDDELDSAINKSGKLNLKASVWSIFEVIDNMKDIAVKGSGLKLLYDIHWGDSPVSIDLPNDPTWMDLALAADKAVKQSGDKHHVFVEDFKMNDKKTLRMYTGS